MYTLLTTPNAAKNSPIHQGKEHDSTLQISHIHQTPHPLLSGTCGKFHTFKGKTNYENREDRRPFSFFHFNFRSKL